MKAKVKETGEIIDVKCLCSIAYSRLDYNGKIIEEYDEEELDFDFDKDPLDVKTIYEFNGEYKLAKYPPKENGFYMTIRCGLQGICICLNEWKDNKLMIQLRLLIQRNAFLNTLLPSGLKRNLKNIVMNQNER